MDLWAFGTSPYGLGLPEDSFWGLCDREYQALKKQFLDAREFELKTIATLRADIHNTAGKSFNKWYKASDFMPGAVTSIEEQARKLMAQGYAPAAAVAMASSTQTREHKLYVVKSAIESARAKEEKQKGRPVKSRLRTAAG